ncbi:MAG: hypothetical protein K0R47_3585 [Brevibacillus sp.]|jgi:hypothetical protein|nr:hypothetical protein [Brevibacillus sp.]
MNKEPVITYKLLEAADLEAGILDKFNRYQETKEVWYNMNDHYKSESGPLCRAMG